MRVPRTVAPILLIPKKQASIIAGKNVACVFQADKFRETKRFQIEPAAQDSVASFCPCKDQLLQAKLAAEEVTYFHSE
jgi:hypothetical protein